MRIPKRRNRLIAVPILIIAIGALLVYTDLIYAKRLEILIVVLMLYVGAEVLFAGGRK